MDASISGISPLWTVFPADQVKNDGIGQLSGGASLRAPGTSDGASSSIFGDIFKNAIQGVRETDAHKNEMEYLIATGQLDNPAELTLASTQAQLSLDLLLQLRSKALDSYSEIMRIGL